MKKMFLVPVVLVLVLASLAIAGERVVYTVKSGDTLGELMFTWKVQGVDIKQIHKWNSSLGTQISVGQQIEYYLPDQPVPQKISAEEIKKIVDETIAAQKKYAPTAQPQVSIDKVALLIGATALFIFLLNILVDRLSRKRKQASILKAEEIEAKKESPKPPAEPTTEWLEIDGYFVRIEIDYVDGEKIKMCYSPFTNASGDRIYEPTKTKIIGSIRRCLHNSKFSEQVKDLQEQENGPIRPLK